MADPLSLAASVLAVIGAAATVTKTLKKIKSFRGAPDQLLQAINEVSDIRTIFATVYQICPELESHNQDASICAELRELVVEAEAHFSFFEEFANEVLHDMQTRSTVEHKVSWKLWLQKRKEVQAHSAELCDIRSKIKRQLEILHVSNIPKVHIRLEDIIYEQRESRQMFNSQLNDLRQTVQSLQTALPAPYMPPPSIASEAQYPSNASSPSNTSPTVHIPATVHLRQGCAKFCMCRCHKKTSLKSPTWMQQLVGALFIGYTAIPTLTTCNERMCIKRQDEVITVSYYFPFWFVQWAISLRCRWTPKNGCMISVRTPRVVSRNSAQCVLIQNGNVTGMQKLFEQGLASPFDVAVGLGRSCLQLAISYSHVEMCKFLLSQYADPYHTDSNSRSCLTDVWVYENVLRRNSSSAILTRQIFEEFIEDYETDKMAITKELNFTTLHQIILGLIDIDLRAYLSTTTAEIDAYCSIGRTPLHLAINRSNIQAIQLLLDFGANTSLTSRPFNRNLIFEAAKSESIDALALLLETVTTSIPSDPDQKNDQMQLINHTDYFGFTAFQEALKARKLGHCQLLLQYQCAIDPLPGSNVSPILLAIQVNLHEILEILLMKGVRTDVQDIDQMGILHMTGAAGDLKTILILLNNALFNASTVDADIYGMTPMKCFEEKRKTYVEEDENTLAQSREAFISLLNKVNSYSLEGDGDENGEG